MGLDIPIATIMSKAITIMRMSRKKAFLTPFQWLSLAFPVGIFDYSHGLEWAIQSGPVTDGASLLNWLTDLITLGSGRSDVNLVALAHKALDDIAALALNEIALTLCASRERRSETCVQGQAFAKTCKDVWGHNMPEVCYSTSLGCGARREGLA